MPTRHELYPFLKYAATSNWVLKLTDTVECANSVNEAVDQYYEDPDRYSNQGSSNMDHSSAAIIINPAHSHAVFHTTGIALSPSEPPSYTLAMGSPPTSAGSQMSPRRSIATSSSGSSYRSEESSLTQAARVRAQDEIEIQKMLHSVQMSCRIYNPEIEPEHETQVLCDCPVHKYWKIKFERLHVLEKWSKAVVYPGEKPYHDFSHLRLSNNNPYANIMSSYTLASSSLRGVAKPDPKFHLRFVQETIALDSALNEKAHAAVQLTEPSVNIWELEQLESLVSDMSVTRRRSDYGDNNSEKPSKRSSFRKAFSVRSSDERTALKIRKKLSGPFKLRSDIIEEEQHRWQDDTDRYLALTYQHRTGIARDVEELRTHKPLQYLHLLRAGYFEPIPIAWQCHTSNPLGFTIDSSAGWRGLTPGWRGYRTTAEERLYWTLKHRIGGETTKKPDLISELDTARERMASAVQLHPRYHSPDDICNSQYPSRNYSKQIMPPSRSFSSAKSPTDETMILMDACGSMNTSPLQARFTQYLLTAFLKSEQPKHQGNSNTYYLSYHANYAIIDLIKAVLRRFLETLSRHERSVHNFQLVTFSNQADYIDVINCWSINEVWNKIAFSGRSFIMVGWQKIKEMHFQKHSETATYHPIYGWQARPHTPNLRLLLMLGSEITDMDEFELTLLDAPWAYVTIFLIGAEDCPRHHRRAGRLQRMADSNPRISLVEAQGLVPERFVTRELLKCHLGQIITMSDIEDLEQHPVELPSPLGPQAPAPRAQSGQTRSRQLLAELVSEETQTWRRQSQPPSRPGLYELPDDPRPVELPATESSALTRRPTVPTRPPPLPPQPELDHSLDPPPPYAG
ncbi:hypothetical protein N7452_004938 [Penicillium brevicompactum]|uniref:VWFA domain-containing protein n=1 Tax=Penicillium brevicompactum TaxID=5074 RepID=A0A9W9UG26_PENBR|nr:hypothetical protein N7452_004938 [Penicillium brevicompactum]